MTINIRKGLLRGLYLVVALILLIMSFQTYMVLEGIKIINAKVKDHIAHRDLLIQAYEAFKDVENSSRGFVMLKDPLYLSYRNKGLIKLGTSLRQLKVEYSIDSMKPRYQEIDSLFTNRLMELDMMLISSDSSFRKPVLSSSAITLEKARILIEENLQREYTVINKYNAMITGKMYRAPSSLLTLVIVSILFLVFSYFSLEKELRTSQSLQSDLKKSYEKLARRKSLLRNILNTNPNGIVAYEAIRNEENHIVDFKIFFASGNLRVLGGKDAESIIGKYASEVYPNLKQSGFFEKMADVTNTGENQSLEVFYPYDGKIGGWFEIFLARMNDGVMLNGRDITHIKTTEEKLRQNLVELEKSNNQLKEFTFIASHDLQEPLRKVSTFANKILDDKRLNSKLQPDVVKIKEAAVRMSQLLDSITGFAKLQVSPTNFQLVDLNKLINQTLIDLELVISEKKAEISFDELPTITCDPDQISQLFFHLITNSLKFNEKKPEVKITYALVEGSFNEDTNNDKVFLRLRFEDNGIGFDSKFQNKLFMIFQRLHNAKKYAGTGIGLAICRKIVENHKGNINAFSNFGSGSTFDVYLPIDIK